MELCVKPERQNLHYSVTAVYYTTRQLLCFSAGSFTTYEVLNGAWYISYLLA